LYHKREIGKERDMATFRYPVILEKGQRNYGVYAPDLPGCISTGYTPERSLHNMQEALHMHLEAMLEDGDIIPPASPIDQIKFDPNTETVHELEVEVQYEQRRAC
jgi:predicted RNase H-like HicB family nuclease